MPITNNKRKSIKTSDPAYQKQLDAEDIILDNLAQDMAEADINLFRKHLFHGNGEVDILLPQIAKILAMSNIIFIDAVLRGAGPVPDSDSEHDVGPVTTIDAKIDIVNMTADILRVLIENKHSEYYIPMHFKQQHKNQR